MHYLFQATSKLFHIFFYGPGGRYERRLATGRGTLELRFPSLFKMT